MQGYGKQLDNRVKRKWLLWEVLVLLSLDGIYLVVSFVLGVYCVGKQCTVVHSTLFENNVRESFALRYYAHQPSPPSLQQKEGMLQESGHMFTDTTSYSTHTLPCCVQTTTISRIDNQGSLIV